MDELLILGTAREPGVADKVGDPIPRLRVRHRF